MAETTSREAAAESQDASVSEWIEGLKTGDQQAAQALWQRYYTQLVAMTRQRLRTGRNRVADEEDVVTSAFASFCRAAENGRFPRLNDRDDLWKLMVTFTERKALNQMRNENRQKRGGGNVRGDSAMTFPSSGRKTGFDRVAGGEPSPAMVAQMSEVVTLLLDALDEEQQAIALKKMEGFTNAEIAGDLDCAVSTVERRLRLIRKKWEQLADAESSMA